jgi:hypothetical protein
MNDCGDANLERIVGRPKASTPKLRPDRCVVGQCTLPIQIDHTFVLSAMFGSNTYVVRVENGLDGLRWPPRKNIRVIVTVSPFLSGW